MSNLMSEKMHHQVNVKTKQKVSFWKKILLIFGVIISIGYIIWQNDDFQRRYLYPYNYRNTINFYADRYDVDRNLVVGVILAESKFDPKACSPYEARGLMQLMPETATWIAGQIEDDNFSIDKLYDPKVNIKYGTWYLSELKSEFGDNEILVLAAYNAGRGNVHNWMKKYNWNDDFSNYDEIPFPETREYVKRVLVNKQEYKRLYK